MAEKDKITDNKVPVLPRAHASDCVQVRGARVHNLRDVDVDIPHNKLTVITGLSGSGKSSLAFDTIYAEGQRRYIETFSAYARRFLGNMEKPDADLISGLSPVISIEQKSVNRNPRSTVGTVTEIYDFLRLLFARAGTAYSHLSGKKMVKYTEAQIIDLIMEQHKGRKIMLLAPVVKGRKGHYKDLFEQVARKGFVNVRVDGEIKELVYGMKTDRYKNHWIEIVVDRLEVNEKIRDRLKKSVALAMKHGKNNLMILEGDSNEQRHYSKELMCPETGISYNEPAPYDFSFNSPQGACPRCKGLGIVREVDKSKIIPDPTLSIRRGGIKPLGKYRSMLLFWQIEAIARKKGFTLDTQIKNIPEEALDIVLFGSDEMFRLKDTPLGKESNYFLSFDGVVNYLQRNKLENARKKGERVDHYISSRPCPECNGDRLKKESLQFRIADKNIAQLSRMDIDELAAWLDGVENKMEGRQKKIAVEILKELRKRSRFLLNVGLGYLSLHRGARSLSGGESQRIRLATQIGSQLVNVLYILDEPSIGLHQRDNVQLINALKQLRDAGNSVIVVEHDRETIEAADHVVDIGPGAGRKGGRICVSGSPAQVRKADSLTGQYLRREKSIPLPKELRPGNGKHIEVIGASGHNLKKVDIQFPLGKLICVTGVSGSGKSSLVNETLHPALSQKLYRSVKKPLPHKEIIGIEHIDKVVEVDQSPLGRTPRSNPATYTNVFTDIRSLFAQLPESKIRGYKPGRFSFNVSGGRCETCKGGGVKTIEMNFLPDVYVECDECYGKRYNRETLEVRYKGKSISDVLDMTINTAVDFFEHIPSIKQKLMTIKDVGLGYITLGQSSTTLSGGESQRVKLASELAKRDTGNTLYILDEPTTGLHFEDISVLMKALNRLVEKGNTVVVIEHNMDVIKMADHIIDMGPEGGRKGGKLIAVGTPSQIIKHGKGHTARFLKEEMEQSVR